MFTSHLPNSAIKILDYLHHQYFQKIKPSDHTSAHWEEFGLFQKLEKLDDSYSLSGVGFGEYKKNSFLNFLISTPSRFYLEFLMSKLDSSYRTALNTLARLTNRILCYDMVRMALTIQLIDEKLGDLTGKKLVIIGDGYGTFGCLLKILYPCNRIIFINLGRTLAFDVFFTSRAYPKATHALLGDRGDPESDDFTYIEAEKVFKNFPKGNLFINIASMQEMNPSVISTYLSLMRSQENEAFFYCANRVEKVLPDGTITRFKDYGWHAKDLTLLSELCPWHQRAPMNRPPFFRKFDGPTWHSLTQLHREIAEETIDNGNTKTLT
jgi:hypothetical protein